jgi:PAS domain S-box-containing protein
MAKTGSTKKTTINEDPKTKKTAPKNAKPKKEPAKNAIISGENSSLATRIDELTLLNEKLLKELFRFRQAENYILFGDYELDIIKDEWNCSPSLLNLFGTEPETFVRINDWIAIIHPEDKQRVIKYFTSLLSRKEDFFEEYRIIRKADGKQLWVSHSGSFEYDGYDNPQKMRGIFREMTRQKEAEIEAEVLKQKLKAIADKSENDALESKSARELLNLKIEEIDRLQKTVNESKNREKQLELEADKLNKKLLTHIENMPLAYIETDYNQTVKAWNRKAEEIFGYSFDEVSGRKLTDLILPETEKEKIYKIIDMLRSGKGGNRSLNQNLTKDGKMITCDWHNTPVYDNEGNIDGWISLVDDISEQVKTLKTLNENEEKIRFIFNNVPLGILHFDINGNVIDLNDNLVSILGANRAGIQSKNVLELKNELIVKEARKTLEGNTGTYEGKYVSEFSGKIVTIRIEISPVLNNENRIIGAIAIIEDISEKKQIEKIFFHDIVNTAGNLKGLAAILSENLESPVKHKYSQMLLNQAEQILAELKTHRYLFSSNAPKLDIKKISSLGFLNEVVSSFNSTGLPRGARLKIAPSSINAEFETDLQILNRVIGNMIKNAIDAAKGNEEIITGCGFEAGMVTFWAHNSLQIPEAIRLQLFTRSVSTKGEGRGLGALSMKILTEQYLKGKIYFTSDEERGTTFVVCFPPEFPVN